MSAGLKSESTWSALELLGGVLYLLVGLILGFTAFEYVGIHIPLSESPGLRLLQILFFGSIGCAAFHVLAIAAMAFVAKIGMAILGGLSMTIEAGETIGRKFADLVVIALWQLARLAMLAAAWPFRQFHARVTAPWLEARRQNAELRRVYQEVKDQFGSFEEFLAAFNGNARDDTGARDDVRTDGQAEPRPVDEFAAACEVLGLAPDGSFTQAAFKARYRKLMKESHPDITGDAALATKLNEARDLIKSRKGWK